MYKLFSYPNWINDFWRIQGLIHFGDKQYFEAERLPEDTLTKKVKRFDKEKVIGFCKEKGIALFDTARKVCRLRDNADDNFLEIVEGTDVFGLLEQMPECRIIVTTGGKASEELLSYLEKKGQKLKVPKVGEYVELFNAMKWWRMPSSSRAYPMKLEKKAEYYRRLFL